MNVKNNNSYLNYLFVIIPVVLASIVLIYYCYNQKSSKVIPKPQIEVQLDDGSLVIVDQMPNESSDNLKARAKLKQLENYSNPYKSKKEGVNSSKLIEDVFYYLMILVFVALSIFLLLLFPHWSGLAAEEKGYSYWVWFACALFLNIVGWLICMLVLSALPNRRLAEKKELRETLSRYPFPECGEAIKKQARICCFCNAVLTPKDVSKFKNKYKKS